MQLKDNVKLYLDRKSIDKKVRQLADRISDDYEGKNPLFVGVLNGSFIFLADLVRRVKVSCEIDFLKLSSYRDNNISSGNIVLLKDLESHVADRDVIVVEDIIDSGLSIKFIRELIMNHKPNSLEFVSLLLKKGISNLNFNIKYIGFKIPNKFVVGYGLDYVQKYRNLKSIYILQN